MTRWAVLAAFALSARAWAQESEIAAEGRQEREKFHDSCVDLKFVDCVQLLFTEHPLHIAAGSLAPQNGFGVGPAFVAHYTPNESWRLFFDTDAVATSNESWRAGAYMTAVFTRHRAIKVTTGGAAPRVSHLRVTEMPVFHAYAQATSLNKLLYYGLGQDTSVSSKSYFGMRETITGASVIWPLWPALHLSVMGEANGRFTDLRGNGSVAGESIDQVYTNATAPGLANQPAYAQFGQGVRVRPAYAGGHILLNYNFAFQEWVASSSNYSFRRLNLDLDQEFPLYRTSTSRLPADFNGPDSCLTEPTSKQCPTISRNLEGSFGVRFLYTGSYFGAGNNVPFYLDRTLGGSDVNGNILLGSYPDYRFRAPNIMVLRGTFEHSLGKFPVGAKFMVDEGRVALLHQDLGFNHLVHSYSAGLTVHAGGLPVIDLLFAWGGHEGTHTIAEVSPSLLGGSTRPSLY